MKKWIVGRDGGEGGREGRKVFGGLQNRVPNNFSRLDTAGYEFGGGDAAFSPGFWPVAFPVSAKAPDASETLQNGPRLRQNVVGDTRVA